MNFPTRKGQKFTALGATYTVKSFSGETGISYNTYDEAMNNNPISKKRGWCCISHEENEGYSMTSDSVLS